MDSQDDNVGSWLRTRAEQQPDAPALSDASRTLSYSQLEDRCGRCAAVLREMGIRHGDRIAIILRNRTAYLEILFAAARCGAIVIPINTRLAPPEITYLIDDASPSVVLYESDLRDRVQAALNQSSHTPNQVLSVGSSSDAYEERLAAASPSGPIDAVSPEDPVILMYTSGTTGHPKGALLPHRKTLYNSKNAESFFDLSPEDRVLVVLPLFHSFGLQILAIPSLYSGASVHLVAGFEPEDIWDRMERHRITFFGGVPTMFRALYDVLSRGERPYDLSTLRFLFTAGAAIPVELIRAFESHGLVLKQGFGQTETSILCCLDADDAIRKAGSVGRPVQHGEVRVVQTENLDEPTDRWRETETGETGEIVVRGPITMLGYWNRPEETAATLREDGWLRTGDLATRDSEGFITLVGRARDMYISGGENVYPAEVEAVYEDHPDVAEIAVVGVPDPTWGEVGCAHVVLRGGARLDAEALRVWGTDRLASFKLPARFVAVDSLPRTASGKVQKHRLTSDVTQNAGPKSSL